ncbi:MAG: hypothetical protein ACRDTG_04830 [Pseudonocardiaceae bacterium]
MVHLGCRLGRRSAPLPFDAARALHALGSVWVLIKGGYLRVDPEYVDLLHDGTNFVELIAVAHAYPLGAGVGPVSPFWRLQSRLPQP